MGNISFQSILIISLLAFFTPIIVNLIKRVKIPNVVGEIFVGLIVGKSFLNLVHNDSWVVFLSNLGLAYLMFLSGLEIDFSEFRNGENRRQNVKRLVICFVMLLLSLLLSYVIAGYLNKMGIVKNVLFTTFLLTASAPGLLVPLLKERDLSDTDYGQTLLLFSLICEFVCLIAITMLSSSISEGLSYKNFLFIIVLLVAFVFYAAAKRVLKRFEFSSDRFRGLHIEVRAAFALMLILVAISQITGTEIVLGAFFAGVVFSLIVDKGREDLRYKMDIIGYGFLVPIFFIEVGVNLNIKAVFGNLRMLIMIPVLLIIFYAVKFVSSILLSLSFGFNKAVSASFLLSSQLSLMIVGLQIAYSLKLVSESTYAVFIVATIISCLLFPLLFDKVFRYEGLIKKPRPATEKICIRETVLTNRGLFDKPLKEVKFPPSCRIFIVIRDGREILPTGETVLKKGDVLLLAGIRIHESEMVDLVTSTR